MLKKVQIRGGARRPHARRSLSTLSVRPRAPYLRRWAFFSILRLRGAAFHDGRDDVGSALGVALEGEDLLLGRLFEELREGGVAVVGLVEGGVLPDHRLLDHRAPQRVLVLAL